MGDIRSESKQSAEIRCSAVDQITPTPSARTKQVLNLLAKHSELTNWDLICFCCIYLSSQLAIIPEFKLPVEHLALLIHKAHYFNGQDFDLYDSETLQKLIELKESLSDLPLPTGELGKE